MRSTWFIRSPHSCRPYTICGASSLLFSGCLFQVMSLNYVSSKQGFSGRHNVGIFTTPPRCRSKVYGPVPNSWGEKSPSGLLVVMSLSVLTDYLNVVLRGSGDDQTHIWRIGMDEFLVFINMALVVAARDGISLSTMPDQRVLSYVHGVLTTLLSRPWSCFKHFWVLWGHFWIFTE